MYRVTEKEEIRKYKEIGGTAEEYYKQKKGEITKEGEEKEDEQSTS